MKILFDGRYIRTDHHDGISKFSARLIEHMAPLALQRGHTFDVLISDAKQRNQYPAGITSHLISSPTSIREPFVARDVNAFAPDVVFSPMQTMGSRGKKYRLVLTIHDLIYYSHPTPPKQFNLLVRALWRLYHLSWWPQRYLLSKADAVVAVSQTTKSLILDNKLTDAPVHVVHNAADAVPGVVNRRDSSSKILIYMGSFMPYKNVDTLVRAMSLLPEYQLHLLSRIPAEEESRLRQLAPDAQLIFHRGCSDDEYFALLGQAHALLMASRDEGFGIPVVEAMATGTPVVLSDITIFREVGGDATLHVVNEPEGFVRAIRELEDPVEWNARSVAGIRQAASFSWKKSAEELIDVLEEVGGPQL